MVNRVLAQKMLKKKRRGKYRVRSGAPSAVREIEGPQRFVEDAYGNTTALKRETITVEVVKFSRQVVNHAENGKPYRKLWKEAKDYLDNYHAALPLRRDDTD